MKTMRTSAITALSLALAGCLGSGGSHRVDCGDGDNVVYDGDDFCVYAAPLIIEGFDCPEAVPFQFPGGDGAVICGPAPDLPQGDIDGIIDLWHGVDQPDVTGGDSIPAPDTWIGQDTAVPDTTEQDTTVADTEPGPTPSFCSDQLLTGAFDHPDGGACTTTSDCGGATYLASCGGEPAFCYCDRGDVTCVATPSCYALDRPVGVACDPGLPRACAESLYCPEDTRICTTLPEPCSELGCYDDLTCAAGDGGRCHGAAPVAGEAGWCAPPLAAPTLCREDGDCGPGWTCDGTSVHCDACGCGDTRDNFGYCTPPASDGAVTLRLDRDHPRASDPPTAIWWNGGSELIWVDCASWRVSVRDEDTHAWVDGAEEAGCTANYLRAIYAGQPLATSAVSVETAAWDGMPRWVRVEGSYYTGCTGFEPSTCAAGPLTITSERVYLYP